MPLPERTLYNVDQLAERWKRKSDDVLHMVERGLLRPHFSISAHCRHERWDEAKSRWYPVDTFGRETDFLCNKGLDFNDPLFQGRRCCIMGYKGIFPLLVSAWFPHRWPFEVPLRNDWQGDLKDNWLYIKTFDDRIALLESHTVTPADFLFPLAEIKRFESEQFRDNEKPKDYVVRRREEGATDQKIARELFSNGISKEMIGRIFRPEPESTCKSTYTKRGEKILGIK
ncbi:hypothetical protein KI809_08520 [Geobacter pelophilus]|uniref:Uncharacterized protein n=1 Tax=Geoanaerobacter pelophilus TaxID=60036 RepID=A0AAW4L5Q1_9BACT|nr:hypothetical protein [Geoanaerobacter pelophilus]MBT0664343.1 hypothetical protein [Geoanaerobacter pelophilus]